MCNPMGLMIASVAMQVGSQVAAGNAAKGQADAEASMLDQSAAEELDTGQQAAGKIRRRTAMQRGEAVAGAAASGIRVGEGSALAVEQYIQQGGEEDAMLTLLNATRRARGLKNQAAMTRTAGKNARLAGWMKGAGSLLSAGSSMGGWGGLAGSAQSSFSQTSIGGSGFGSGLAYGNRDLAEGI